MSVDEGNPKNMEELMKLHDEETIGDWYAQMDDLTLESQTIETSVTPSATPSSATSTTQPPIHTASNVSFTISEPLYLFVTNIDQAATDEEVYYFFGGPNNIFRVHMYESPAGGKTEQEHYNLFKGECMLEIVDINALENVLQRHTKALRGKVPNIYYSGPVHYSGPERIGHIRRVPFNGESSDAFAIAISNFKDWKLRKEARAHGQGNDTRMEYSHDRRSYGPGNYFYKDRYYQQSHGQGNYQTKSRTYLPTLPMPLSSSSKRPGLFPQNPQNNYANQNQSNFHQSHINFKQNPAQFGYPRNRQNRQFIQNKPQFTKNDDEPIKRVSLQSTDSNTQVDHLLPSNKSTSQTTLSSNPFGNARPVDQTKKLDEMEQKLLAEKEDDKQKSLDVSVEARKNRNHHPVRTLSLKSEITKQIGNNAQSLGNGAKQISKICKISPNANAAEKQWINKTSRTSERLPEQNQRKSNGPRPYNHNQGGNRQKVYKHHNNNINTKPRFSQTRPNDGPSTQKDDKLPTTVVVERSNNETSDTAQKDAKQVVDDSRGPIADETSKIEHRVESAKAIEGPMDESSPPGEKKVPSDGQNSPNQIVNKKGNKKDKKERKKQKNQGNAGGNGSRYFVLAERTDMENEE